MQTSLSVVIPAYNEQDRIAASLETVAGYLRSVPGRNSEILVVNDGSTDHTAEVCRRVATRLAGGRLHIGVLENPGNCGKGYSVRCGMAKTQYDWVLYTDADLSAPIEECDKLLAAVARSTHDVAIGSRALDRSLIEIHQPLFREAAGRIFNLAVRAIADLPFADTQCGFKLFSRRAVEKIFAAQMLDRFGFDVEILYLARKLHFSIAEVPVRWSDAKDSKVQVLDGVDAFLDIFRVRWNDSLGRYKAIKS